MPLLILTVQRTGGTTLANALQVASRARLADHEPFLMRRKWGWITALFDGNETEETILANLRQVLAGATLIKHCCELHDDRFNRLLIDAASALGYAFLVLYRENEGDRLLSRIFARQTGIFLKPDLALTHRTPDELMHQARSASPRDIESEIARSRSSVASLLAAVTYLEGRRRPYVLAKYENLFDPRSGFADFRSLLRRLGIGRDLSAEERHGIGLLLANGGQGTKDYYGQIPFAKQIEKEAKDAWMPLVKRRQGRPGSLVARLVERSRRIRARKAAPS